MGKINSFQKIKGFVGVLLQDKEQASLVQKELEENLGPIDFISPILDFQHTSYYEKEMGAKLFKCFFSFQKLVGPNEFFKLKILSNEIEDKYTKAGKRTMNLDPGAITSHNLMLLTTKDFAHRIPLQNGIYAEVTLIWNNKTYQDLPWTYPDFKSQEYKKILTKIRALYVQQLANLVQ
ncbi:DUF4416 family protein [Candidatus Margulisiibacteriota bacterium]